MPTAPAPKPRKLAPFRRVVVFAECRDVLAGRRLIRVRLECHHELHFYSETARADQRVRCADCRDGKPGRRISKAALASWGL